MNHKIIVGMSSGLVALLTVLGCVFLSARGMLFPSQLFWILMGGCAYAGAVGAGWSRCLKAAPFLLAVWVALLVCAHAQPPINGGHGWVAMGWLKIEVFPHLPVVAGLFLAWLGERFGWSARRVVLLASLGVGTVMAVGIAGNANRLEFLATILTNTDAYASPCWAQRQCCAAIHAANWFSGSGLTLDGLPYSATANMPAAASLLLGKWFVVLVMAVFCKYLSVVGATAHMAANNARRTFCMVFGGIVAMTFLQAVLQCVMVTPPTNIGIPLASLGGASAFAMWAGTGILVAAIRAEASEGKHECPMPLLLKADLACLLAFALITLTFARCSDRGLEYGVPAATQRAAHMAAGR